MGNVARKFLSYATGLGLGLLIIHPWIPYKIPVIINSFQWIYLVCASGLVALWLALEARMNLSLKILLVYLFISCFIAQAPYLAFNAFVLVVGAYLLYRVICVVDIEPIISCIAAAFWVQFILTIFQVAGMDTLMNFGRDESVFFGTVMQYMRHASILAVIAPFLLMRSKWYLVPIILLCILSRSSTFALALIAGGLIYYFLSGSKHKLSGSLILLGVAVLYVVYDWGSFRGAVIPSNGGRLISWAYVLKTWVLDTSQAKDVTISAISGPFQWKWFLFGHGMDSFLPLFPLYKHDANPFPQAHNDWLQILWETGVLGFGILLAYCVSLVRWLLRSREIGMVAGCAVIATVMFFAFPMRMTQTMFLLVAWAGICQRKINDSKMV